MEEEGLWQNLRVDGWLLLGVVPQICTMGIRPFPGVKRLGRGADRQLSSKRRGHERVGLYLYSPSGLSWPLLRRTLPFTFTIELLQIRNWMAATLAREQVIQNYILQGTNFTVNVRKKKPPAYEKIRTSQTLNVTDRNYSVSLVYQSSLPNGQRKTVSGSKPKEA